mmetsp:Transcript_35787/g.83471  ORF Transcript_35787/g.83471 Transcript_35787/m.83471 type:complete len:231 (-) Transcript_35787:404-1096(-)
MKLSPSHLIASFVKISKLVRVVQNGIGFGGVRVRTIRTRGIDQIIGPIIHLVRRSLQRLHVLVSHLAQVRVPGIGKAVRCDDQHAQSSHHPADPEVIPAAAAGAVGIYNRASQIGILQSVQHSQTVPSSHCRAFPPGTKLCEKTLLLGILEHGIQGLHVCSSQSRFWLATIHPRQVLVVLHAEELPKFPDPAEPKLFPRVSLVGHVGLEQELSHGILRQKQEGVLHRMRV